MCSPLTEQCVLQECSLCPGAEGITVKVFKISEEISVGKVTSAMWNKDELEKITTSFGPFFGKLQEYTLKANIHKFIKDIQKKK